jgi:hypothetical protein
MGWDCARFYLKRDRVVVGAGQPLPLAAQWGATGAAPQREKGYHLPWDKPHAEGYLSGAVVRKEAKIVIYHV